MDVIIDLLAQNNTVKAIEYTYDMIYRGELVHNEINNILITACQYKNYKYINDGFGKYKFFTYHINTVLTYSYKTDDVKLYKIILNNFTFDKITFVSNVYDCIYYESQSIINFIILKYDKIYKFINTYNIQRCYEKKLIKTIKLLTNLGYIATQI